MRRKICRIRSTTKKKKYYPSLSPLPQENPSKNLKLKPRKTF
jgi:hypothetical protein